MGRGVHQYSLHACGDSHLVGTELLCAVTCVFSSPYSSWSVAREKNLFHKVGR